MGEKVYENWGYFMLFGGQESDTPYKISTEPKVGFDS
jgi:hypothetical protein